MKQQATTPSVQQHQRQSAATREAPIAGERTRVIDSRESATAQRKMADMVAQSPLAVAQRAFNARINNSPRMVAQRMQLENLVGRADQQQENTGVAPVQGKFETAQRPTVNDEHALQPKFASEAPVQLDQQASPKPNNTGLPDQLKSGIESLSGMSMDNVKVHYNSSQPAQLNALAYAQGSDIHVGPGQEKHLPHEAWHVVQQAQGRVKPTMQMKEGIPVNDDQGLEHEADLMGAKALQQKAHDR